jgi:hypothetical protein
MSVCLSALVSSDPFCFQNLQFVFKLPVKYRASHPHIDNLDNLDNIDNLKYSRFSLVPTHRTSNLIGNEYVMIHAFLSTELT